MQYRPRWQLPPANLLASSHDRGWRGIGAELRCHSAGELPEMVADTTVIALALRGDGRSLIHRRGAGVRQATPARTGTVWLCPQGVAEDAIRITGPVPAMLHLYLPSAPFAALAREDAFPEVSARSVRYAAGFTDPLVSRLGAAVAAELAAPSVSGRLLVETAALTLAAWLLHAHSNIVLPEHVRTRTARPLDPARLRRVLALIEASLGGDVGIADLAAVACLSPFHFARAFKAATGTSPHRFVADRRLQRARDLLERSDLPLAEIAPLAGFASQAGFTRAFTRAVGLAPGAYRRRSR